MPFRRPHAISIRLSRAELSMLDEAVAESGLARADILRLGLRAYCKGASDDVGEERDLSAAFDSVRERPSASSPGEPDARPIPGCQAPGEGEA